MNVIYVAIERECFFLAYYLQGSQYAPPVRILKMCV